MAVRVLSETIIELDAVLARCLISDYRTFATPEGTLVVIANNSIAASEFPPRHFASSSLSCVSLAVSL